MKPISPHAKPTTGELKGLKETKLTSGAKTAQAKPQTEVEEAPAFVLAVTAREIEGRKEKPTYSPEEIRAKAATFLDSGKASPEEKAAVERVLGDVKKKSAKPQP